MTLQRRVLAYLAVAAVAACALTVAVAAVLVRHRVAAQRLTGLEQQAEELVVGVGAPGALQDGAHVYRFGAGRTILVRRARRAAVLAALPAAANAEGTIRVAGRSLIYVARSTGKGKIVLVRSAALAFAEWRPFLGSLVLAGLGGVIVALGLSLLLARRLTRPIHQLAGATRRLAAGEPRVAVEVHGEDELAQLAESFNAMSESLACARDSQREFLESVSHELKTPLTSIRGFAEALEEGAVAPGEGARVISAEAGRLERLVTDLLELARLGRASFRVAHEPVDLTAVAEQTRRRHVRRASELGVQLQVRSAPDARALGDEDRLLQAVSNLVENALRLTPAGGSVVIGACPGTLSVADTGPGLATEDLPRAFERFYLHRRYRSERAVGSGLGLAIVTELIGAMGGSVVAGNRAGGGAEFTLTLAHSSGAPTPERSAPPDAVRPSV